MKGKPGIKGFLVVASVDVPALLFVKGISSGEGEEVSGGHNSTGEEVTCHPFICMLGFVKESVGVMGKDMDKDFSAGLEPSGDLTEELAMVADVFEHFNGDEAVKLLIGLEVVDIASDDLEVGESTPAGLFFNVLALGVGIGNGGDLGLGIARRHEKAERTPAASEFEDVLSVAELGALAGEGEHVDLGLFEGGTALAP